MSDRRYEVYGPCANCKGHVVLGVHHDLVDPYGERLPPTEELCQACGETGRTRLVSIPDALVEAAADAIDALGFDTLELRNWGDDSVANATELVARAALSVLFPGEEEE